MSSRSQPTSLHRSDAYSLISKPKPNSRSLDHHQRESLTDIETFTRFSFFLDVLKTAHDNESTVRTVVSAYETSLSEIEADDRGYTSHDDSSRLRYTLHRIARHMKERSGAYAEIRDFVRRQLELPGVGDIGRYLETIDEAVEAVNHLNRYPTNPEDVHDALRKVSAAAHSLFFLQRDHIIFLRRELAGQAAMCSKLDERVRQLEGRHHGPVRTKVTSERPVVVTSAEAQIVAKLVALKATCQYPRMSPGPAGNKQNPITWMVENLTGNSRGKLSRTELDVILGKPTLAKPFSARLYQTLLKRKQALNHN